MSISPEPVSGPILPPEEQIATRGIVDLVGPAGSVFLVSTPSSLADAELWRIMQLCWAHDEAERPLMAEVCGMLQARLSAAEGRLAECQ